MRFITFLALYVAYSLLAFNQPFLSALFDGLSWNTAQDILFGMTFMLVIVSMMSITLLSVFWPWTTKPIAIILLFCNAAALYFIESYQIVINADMINNILGTDHRETLDLLTPRLFAYLLLYAALPSLIIGRMNIHHPKFLQGIALRVGLIILLLSSSLGLVYIQFKDFSTYFRLHRDDQSLWIPRNYLWGIVETIQYRFRVERLTLPIGQDASYSPNDPPLLLVLVIGETARAANSSLYGYNRLTNPKLQQQAGLITLPVTESCGTSTAISLPCIFSPLDHDAYKGRQNNTEFMPLMLSRLGLDISYIENNFGGCKHTCTGAKIDYTVDAQDSAFCNSGECLDGILVDRLKKNIQGKQGDQLVILHQNGSHGPRYDKRYPQEFEIFSPVCQSADIRKCDQQQLINGYDNSLIYTDHVLAEVIATLKSDQRKSMMLYVSDHGESLGENGLYLHGLPDAIAPAEQTEVPFFLWQSNLSEQAQGHLSECLQQTQPQHAHIFHIILGAFGVEASEYKTDLDIVGRCVR